MHIVSYITIFLKYNEHIHIEVFALNNSLGWQNLKKCLLVYRVVFKNRLSVNLLVPSKKCTTRTVDFATPDKLQLLPLCNVNEKRSFLRSLV